MILGWFLLGVASFVQADLPTLSARGQATIAAPADTVSLNIAVVTTAKTATDAMKANREKMDQVIASLKSIGLEKNEYQTGRFSIDTLYSNPPKDHTEEYVREITGYEVRNQLVIKTTQLDLIGSLIDQVTQAGVNNIDQLQFSIANTDDLRLKAIEEAVKRGALEAKAAATAAGTKIRRIKEIQIDPGLRPQPMLKANFMMAESSTHIKPGDVEVSAEVNLVYEIAE